MTEITQAWLDETERLAKAATPGPWVCRQTVINGQEYGGHWVEIDETRQFDGDLIKITGSGSALSLTSRVFGPQPHDDNEANAKYAAAMNPATAISLIAALRDRGGGVEEVARLNDDLHFSRIVVSNLISNSSAPLKELGEWLTNKCDEDEWPRAESLLLKVAKDHESALSAANARIAALTEALRPFAKAADAYDPPEGDDDDHAWDERTWPTLGQLRAARAALVQPAKEMGGE